jgi:thiol:disulfide interchange protein DsbD
MLDLSVLDSALYVQLGVAFFAGFLTFFTPCVYPLVPITLAIFGGGVSDDGKNKTCKVKSLLYAAGIATTYTTLGILAAQCGLVFGSYMGSGFFLALVSTVLIVMTLSTVGIMELPFLHKLQAIGCKLRCSGKSGAYLSGLVSGLIAAPCVGPTLVAILSLAASHQKPIIGSTLMATYAIGFSLPFIALGTFGQLIKKLPQSGAWMMSIKGVIASGIILTLMYLFSGHVDWFLTNINKDFSLLTSIIIALAGLALILFATKHSKPWVLFLGSLTLSISIYSHFLFVPSISKENMLIWSHSLEKALKVARSRSNETDQGSTPSESSNNIIMVKAYSDWCSSCKELEEKTFSSQHVQSELKNHILVGVNFSEIDPEVNRFSNQYNIVGVPTLLFLNKDGSEISNSRITGFVTAQQLVNHIQHISLR